MSLPSNVYNLLAKSLYDTDNKYTVIPYLLGRKRSSFLPERVSKPAVILTLLASTLMRKIFLTENQLIDLLVKFGDPIFINNQQIEKSKNNIKRDIKKLFDTNQIYISRVGNRRVVKITKDALIKAINRINATRSNLTNLLNTSTSFYERGRIINTLNKLKEHEDTVEEVIYEYGYKYTPTLDYVKLRAYLREREEQVWKTSSLK
jgi:hypothetical protein